MKKRYLVFGIVLLMIIGATSAYWWHKYHDVPRSVPSKQAAHIKPKPAPSYTEQILAKMSLRDKVASLFILHSPGVDAAVLKAYYVRQKPAGLILMGDNIPMSLAALTMQNKALTVDPKLPPFISVDEEGDTVTRLAADTFAGPLTLRNQPPVATKTAFIQRSDLLKSAGFNLNFGIIADVTANPNSFIYERVLGTTPQAASERVAQAVAGTTGRTLSVIKHFPGHGETEADSHQSIPTAATTYPDWRQRVALPFQAGIDAGADMVMFGHLRYASVDQQPASLSKKWHDIVRNQLKFKGIILTDDMIMLQNSGEPALTDPVKNAITALQAGNDMLLYVLNHDGGSTSIDPDVLIDGVVAAVENGQISTQTINARALRVLDKRYQIAN
jgi:beta-N-acetylhexosaminidase